MGSSRRAAWGGRGVWWGLRDPFPSPLYRAPPS
jgi:hypothetical protein